MATSKRDDLSDLKKYFKRKDFVVDDTPVAGVELDTVTFSEPGLSNSEAKIGYIYKDKIKLLLGTPPTTPREFLELAYAINYERGYYGSMKNPLPCPGLFYTEEETKEEKKETKKELAKEDLESGIKYWGNVIFISDKPTPDARKKEKISLILNLLNDAASAGDIKAKEWIHYLNVSPDTPKIAKDWLISLEKAAKKARAAGFTFLPPPPSTTTASTGRAIPERKESKEIKKR